MYQEFFRLNQSPFSLDPDPRFLYLSPAHATARAYLDYTVESRDGMVVLSGPAGCGKSILVADLCRRVDADDIILLDQTQLDPRELLQSLLLALGESSLSGERPELHARLRDLLCARMAAGRRMTLVVDEAQHLPWETLEALRMVSDQQHQGRRLLAVILVGQPGLAATLKSRGLEQLRQRVRLSYQLGPLPRPETRRYIEHRLAVAGGEHDVVISPRALKTLRRYSGGVPRLINTLMDMALTAAALERTRVITSQLVSDAARELQWEPFFLRSARLFADAQLRHGIGYLSALIGRVRTLAKALRQRGLASGAWRWAETKASRMPTQWLAGLAGAIAVLVPLALVVPSWMAQTHAARERITFTESPLALPATASPSGAAVDGPPSPTSLPSRARRSATPAPAPAPTAVPPTPTAVPPTPTAVPPTATPTLLAHDAQEPQSTAPSQPSVKGATPASEAPPVAAVTTSTRHAPWPLKDEGWLLRQPTDGYSVQLFAARAKQRIERVLREHGSDFRRGRELATFTAERGDEPWYVLVLAPFPSYDESRRAIDALPTTWRAHQPWVKRIDEIQSQIAERQAARRPASRMATLEQRQLVVADGASTALDAP